MTIRTLTTAAFAAGALVLAAGGAATASTHSTTNTGTTATSANEPQLINDADLKATTVTMGGASVLPTTRTIPHWFGQTKDPSNGVTYGYNMVGADPHSCSGAACDVTIQVDITPIKVIVGGETFDGNDVLPATLASPQFADNDYGSTPAATAAGAFPQAPAFVRGQGGALSQLDAGVPLQLQDATMRAQFAKTGASTYHLRLHANVLAPVTITVPSNQGLLIQSGRGVLGGNVDVGWWSSKINNLEQSADPTHLPLYLTDNIFLHSANDPTQCCIIGYHGTRAAGNGGGSTHSQGNATVQTFAWASYVRPGFYSRPNGGTDWALQDIHAISHEIAGVGGRPVRQQQGEPVAHADGAAVRLHERPRDRRPRRRDRLREGHEHLPAGPEPERHAERRRLLPPGGRGAAAVVPAAAVERDRLGAEPVRCRGRYTFMGDLNPFPGFRQPATGC